MLKLIANIKSFYDQFKRFNPIVFFLGGFTWDSITLRRIDQLLDNFILLFYLLLLGMLIIVVSLVENDRIQNPFIVKYRGWYPLGLQFFLGGLFSAYVVFYFQSASLTRTAMFLGILIILLVANEFLEKKLTNFYLLIALYFMASFSFFIFFIPVVFKLMNVFTFIIGGVLSLALVGALLYFLVKKAILPTRQAVIKMTMPVIALYLLFNVFYWQNWIPPVPLSLKFSGIYHHASKNHQTSTYTLRFEKPKWYQPFKKSDNPFHYAEGDTVACFTSIFAPTMLTKKIFHHWQQYFPRQKKWVSTDRLGYSITGYRDGGYRGFTRKVNIAAGEWRVNVETEEGILLGRIRFNIEPVEERVPLKTIYR
ncbi:MAG: DUF2914 domain-containing protein [bacterium]